MDDKWFKQQQKRVGVTAEDIANRMGRTRANVSHILTGRQRMTLEWAEAFAEVLQVPIATVLEKAGVATKETTHQLMPGFAESDAAPFYPPPAQSDLVGLIAKALGASRPGVDLWHVKSQVMALAGLLEGDFMLIDTHQSERVRPGDVVIAQAYQRNGTATTILRRFEPPVLISASARPEDGRVFVVDGDNVAIRGKVIASWRTQ